MSLSYSIKAASLTRLYNRSLIFENISFALSTGESLAITGPNGSGKSTLIDIIAGVRRPSSGSVEYSRDGNRVVGNQLNDHIGYLSPRINLYNELTSIETLDFIAGARGMNKYNSGELLGIYGLSDHVNKKIANYSSGMKQRLKFIISILHNPPVILLDEPTVNLDAAGSDAVFSYIDSVRSDKIIVIATNEACEADFCGRRISLA